MTIFCDVASSPCVASPRRSVDRGPRFVVTRRFLPPGFCKRHEPALRPIQQKSSRPHSSYAAQLQPVQCKNWPLAARTCVAATDSAGRIIGRMLSSGNVALSPCAACDYCNDSSRKAPWGRWLAAVSSHRLVCFGEIGETLGEATG